MSNSQYGFRPGKSTIQAVHKIVEEILKAFEEKETVSMVLFDLTKAFDCIPFDVLIKKLEFYGITGNALNIFKSYITNRRQFVSIKSTNSSIREVKTGVPQGSVLGPFLFLIAVNDLPINIHIDTVLYADDTTIFKSGKDLVSLQEEIDRAKNSALNWFSKNKLVCNQEKTQHIIFNLAQNNDTNSVKLLGIHLDSKLNWQAHINSICTKLSRVIYLLWKLKPLVNTEYLKTAYYGLFQSHISYGLLLWGHSSHTSDILLLQKKAVRILSGAGYLEHCKPLFIEQEILTVANLYIFTILIHTKTHLQEFNCRKDIHSHNTRQKSQIDIPHHRLTKSGKSFKILSVSFFNKLHESAQTISLSNFKSRIHNWLVKNPFYDISEFLEIPGPIYF